MWRWMLFCNIIASSSCILHKLISGQFWPQQLAMRISEVRQVACSVFSTLLLKLPHPLALQHLQHLALWVADRRNQPVNQIGTAN
jgi:hypothetical protein